MPAAILVHAGPTEIRQYWIEDEVIRIGRDASCDLSFPGEADVAPHAATVEYAGGRYLVYNRSDAPLRLGDGEVPARGKAPWGPAQAIKLGGLTLVLELQADPSPGPMPDAHAAEIESDEPDELPVDEAAPKTSRTQVQLAVIVGGGALMAGVLALGSISPPPTATPALTLEQVRALVAGAPEAPRGGLERRGAALQAAHGHRRRGEPADARAICLRVRDELAAPGPPDPPRAVRIARAALKRYALDELNALGAEAAPR